jgi:hypothetical protein
MESHMKAILAALAIFSLLAVTMEAAAQPGGGPGGTVKDTKDSKDSKGK